ncbi:Thioesterase superfamily protein [Tsuneonella dongtanensis]|uniref:Thioesterase superfamily protein n=1 Tax=Tsuneonella dongtanensis TaxID=692370 RepID=A0A1B2ACV1_9SPHN|nr:PaaI family thioesterase [Tsuneonella dongtanensis]ANY19976.1 Thioesterase superfamily protein [Tsuneonella dongtanensis]
MNTRLTSYARSMGIIVGEHTPGDAPVLSLPFAHEMEGRPGAWHGGAIAGLLETAGYAALRSALDALDRHPTLKPINVTVQYLSTGRTRESYARGRIVRLGRRNANLSIEAWQDDPLKPIATAVMNVLMVDPE